MKNGLTMELQENEKYLLNIPCDYKDLCDHHTSSCSCVLYYCHIKDKGLDKVKEKYYKQKQKKEDKKTSEWFSLKIQERQDKCKEIIKACKEEKKKYKEKRDQAENKVIWYQMKAKIEQRKNCSKKMKEEIRELNIKLKCKHEKIIYGGVSKWDRFMKCTECGHQIHTSHY